MARLPSAVELGGLPSASSGRQVSSIDASAIGTGMQTVSRGMMVLAQGQQAMGQGVAQGLDLAARSFKVDDDLADLQTRADFMSEKMRLEKERDNEFDPAKLSEYPGRFETLRQTYAKKYGDQRRAQKFLIETQDDAVRGGLQAEQRKIGIENNNFVASKMETLERLKREALEAKDEAEKVKRIDLGTQIYDEMAAKGLIRPQEAVAAKQKWVKDYGITDFRMKTPEDRLVALRGNDGALIQSESGANPRAENKFGFLGLFQFGAPRVAHLGVYTPGAGEDLKTFNNTLANAPGKWSGTFNIPGFPNVRTKADFLANPDAQEKVYQLHQEKISQEIKANGFDKYIGQTIKGIPITENGIRNMMHLGGVNSTQLFFTSGGVIDKADDNGKRLSDYARMGATAGPSKMLSILDPAERQQLLDETNRELMQKAHVAEQEARADALAMEAQRKSQINALEVGIMDDTLSRSDFLKARAEGTIRDEPETIRRIENLLKDQESRIERRVVADGIMSGAIAYNPLDENHKKAAEEMVDFVAKKRGIAKEDAAILVYDQTGMMTKAGVQAMRGRLLDNSPDSIMAVGQMAATAMYKSSQRFPNGNPRVFDAFDGGKELSELGTMWSHFRGLMGDDDGSKAAKTIMEMRSPGWKSNVNLNEKEETEFKKGVKDAAIKDFGNADLFGSGVFYDNRLLPEPMKNHILNDYASEAVRYFKKYGNESLAKKMAMDQIKTVYGVSNGYIQKFPVEKALPDMQIDGSHKWAYEAAARQVQTITGQKVDPANVFLTERPLETADGFRAKSPNTLYSVTYLRDVDGFKVPETLPLAFAPGQHFPQAFGAWQQKQETAAKAQRELLREGLQPPSPVVRPEDIGSRSMRPGRPARTPEERQALADEATAFRQQRMDEARQAAPSMADKQKARDEALKNAEPSALSDWAKSTPSLRDAFRNNPPARVQLGPSRSRLPGDKQ